VIFGETLYSPCNGRVLTAVDSVPDNAAGEYYEGEQGSGNHVLIQCQDVEIGLVHMLAGSVLVREGEQVTVGTPLGQVGNSGFSTEPHLHLQALKTNSDGKVTSIPMHFNGRFLVRNDVIKNQAHNQQKYRQFPLERQPTLSPPASRNCRIEKGRRGATAQTFVEVLFELAPAPQYEASMPNLNGSLNW